MVCQGPLKVAKCVKWRMLQSFNKNGVQNVRVYDQTMDFNMKNQRWQKY